MKWTQAEKAFVEPQRVARLATVDAGGIPHNVPICPLFLDGKIYLGTAADARKVRNIQSNANVAIVFDDYCEAWGHLRGIMVQGRARILGAQDFRRMQKKLYAKYHLYETAAPLDDDGSAIVEISPGKKFSWGL